MTEDLKKIIAENLCKLRHDAGYTQLEIAEKLNYSDKAVSKWESGASIPDITVLCDIAKIYGVTVDYLLCEEHKIPVKKVVHETFIGRKQLFGTLTYVAVVWLLAIGVFALLTFFKVQGNIWLTFIWAVPISAFFMLKMRDVWKSIYYSFTVISVIIWTVTLGIYLSLLFLNLWMIFLVAVPVEAILVFNTILKK